MATFLIAAGVITLVVIGVVVLSEWRANRVGPKNSTTYLVEAERSPNKAQVPDLMRSQTAITHTELAESNPLRRYRTKRKKVKVAGATKEVVTAETEMIKAQADQIKTVLGEQNAITDLQTDGELKPVEKEKKESAFRADIAENRLREVQAKKAIEDLAAPRQAIERKQTPSRLDSLERQWRRQLEDGVGVQAIYEKLVKEAERDTHSPEALKRARLDKLKSLLEDELQK